MGLYKITDKCFDGVNITGFKVNDGQSEKLVSYIDAVMLAKKGKIDNAEAIFDTSNNEYDIVVEGYNSLGSVYKNAINKISLVSRIVDGVTKRCSGFIVKNESGEQFRMSSSKLWIAAAENGVQGVKGKICNGKRVILSEIDGYLESLPKVTV